MATRDKVESRNYDVFVYVKVVVFKWQWWLLLLTTYLLAKFQLHKSITLGVTYTALQRATTEIKLTVQQV